MSLLPHELRADVVGTSVASVVVVSAILFALFWGAISYYCLRPSTRKQFADARESMVRARAQPG
jgi:hypothetical protein